MRCYGVNLDSQKRGEHPWDKIDESVPNADGRARQPQRRDEVFDMARVLRARPSATSVQCRVNGTEPLFQSGLLDLWAARGRAAPVAFERPAKPAWEMSFARDVIASGLCTVVCTLKANGAGPGGAPCNGPSPLPSPCIQRGRQNPPVRQVSHDSECQAVVCTS